VGESLTFEVEPAGDGKKRAIKVERPAAAARVRSPNAPRDTASRPHRRPAGRRSYAGTVITALFLVGVGAFAFVQLKAARSGFSPSVQPTPTSSAPYEAAPAYRCDGRIHCSQMASCEEAKFFLRNCPGTQMDGDHDGIPCEQQWCTGALWR
jgi:hypothetical protein